MLTRRSLLFSAAAIAAAPYFLSESAQAATPKNILVMAAAIDDVVGGFDPAEAYEPASYDVCGNLYRTLVTVDPADPTRMIGDLATSWDVSEDGLTLTFQLQDDLVFESGNPLTAEDAAFSLQRVVKLNLAPGHILTQFGWTADNVDGLIRTDGSRTLVLTLPEIQAPGIVLSCLSDLCGSVVDKVEVLKHETDGDLGNNWLKTHSAGSGAYRLVEWLASDRIVLETNPNAAVKPAIPRIVIRHVSDPATQLLLLQKGDVDIARDLGSDQLKSIAGNPDFTFIHQDTLTLMYVAMNMGLPELQKPQVRQAIKWAIDYQAIAKNITPDLWNVWQSFLPKGTPGAIDDNPFQKDVAKAKALLAEAGYPDGLSLTLDYPVRWPFSEIAQAVQADLAEIGIEVQLLAGERKQVITKMRARQHQLAMGRWGPDYIDANGNAVAFCANSDDSDTSAVRNPSWTNHFVDPELTEAVNAAARELSAGKRLETYAMVQRASLERSPYAFLVQQANVAVLRKGVSGLSLGVLDNYTRYSGIQKV